MADNYPLPLTDTNRPVQIRSTDDDGVHTPHVLIPDCAPAANAAAVTPNDGSDLASPTRAIFVTADGDVSVNMAGEGDAVVFAGLTAGMLLPIRVTRVLATGTTGSVIALW